VSGGDGVPGRRRAVPRPFEESASLLPTDEDLEPPNDRAIDPAPPVIGGSHVRPPLGGGGRRILTPGGAHAQPARPAARPASRAPSLPVGPVLLPSAERPAARPPGARRAEVPTLVGPAVDEPAGRRIAATVEPAEAFVEPVGKKAVTAPATPQRPSREPVREPARRAERRTERADRRVDHQPAITLSHASAGTGWVILLALAVAGVVASRVSTDLPDLLRQVSAGALSGALAWGLAVRTGGRPIWAAVLTAALAVGAFVSDWNLLLSGASVGTGVLAATLAVMATTPAATFGIAIREVVIATAIAWVGAVGVIGYGPGARPQVDPTRIDYAVLGLSLAGAFALVYRLGAGLHGLGRRGYVVAGGAVLMLAFALAYSEAIAQWGSRDLVGWIDDLRDSTRSTLGAVPHPIVAVLGYPALVWGVFMRARRRQGWWVCAFGVAATAPSATRLVAADLDVGSVILGAVYSFVIGIAVGYLVIRVDQSLTGTHGRRARRDEEAVAHRPEPGRTRPLH
jgi:hypothetical protein